MRRSEISLAMPELLRRVVVTAVAMAYGVTMVLQRCYNRVTMVLQYLIGLAACLQET
jgi:hypothetical protein